MNTLPQLGTVVALSLTLSSVSMAQGDAPASPVLLPQSSVMAAFTPQQVRPGRDRFNNSPPLTHDGLVEALKSNKTFRTNLARHFGLPEERVVDFVQDALVPQVLPRATQVRNYGVTRTGSIYSKLTTLKKGTRVWATRDGKPVLKWDCSNPLLPKVPVLRDRPRPVSVSIERVGGVIPPSASILGPPDIQAPIGITMAMDTPSGNIPVIPGLLEPDTAPRPFLPSVARAGFPLLPLAGVIGIVVRSKPKAPNTIPEPGALVLVTLGAVGLGLLRRRR